MNASLFLAMALLIGAGFVGFGVVLLLRGDRDRRHAADWVPAAGTVIGAERGDVAPMTSNTTVTVRYPIVRYVDENGREQQGRAVTAVSWQRPAQGQQVGLRYDPHDPRSVMLDGAPARGVLTAIVAVLFVVFGLFWGAIGMIGLLLTS
jgi:hypothetical protein